MCRAVLRCAVIPLALLFISACDGARDNRGSDTPKVGVPVQQAKVVPKAVFREPIEPAKFELATGALSIWRTYSSARPALLLFASHPLLTPIDAAAINEIRDLIASGPEREVIRRGSAVASDTLLVSPQTVSAAISANIFSEIILVLPNRDAPNKISFEKLVKRVVEAGFLTPEEGAAMRLNGSIVNGMVRGVPFRIAHPDALPALDLPLILHVDLSYFKESYVNEVKTPIYDLIYNFATSVRDAGYKPTAVTLSFSNQEVGYALTSRFVIRDLALLLRNPGFLDGGTPASWSLRASALYASIMFDETKARELIQQAAKETPGDAAALFDLALVHFQQNEPAQGFVLLDRAVAIDPGYALAYVELADQGMSMGRWSKSLDLLEKAVTAFPENAELRVRLAGDLIQRGRAPDARPLLEALAKLPWTTMYHSGMPETLRRMQEAAKIDSLPLPDVLPPSEARAGSPRRMPSHMAIPMQTQP